MKLKRCYREEIVIFKNLTSLIAWIEHLRIEILHLNMYGISMQSINRVFHSRLIRIFYRKVLEKISFIRD